MLQTKRIFYKGMKYLLNERKINSKSTLLFSIILVKCEKIKKNKGILYNNIPYPGCPKHCPSQNIVLYCYSLNIDGRHIL